MIRSRRLLLAVAAVLLVLAFGTLGNLLIVGHVAAGRALHDGDHVSTIGYHELPPLDAAGKIFTMLLIVLGVGTTYYTLVALAEFLIEGRVRDLLGRRAMKRTISLLKDHVVLCGYGRFGRVVADELAKLGMAFVAIETNAGDATRARGERPSLRDRLRARRPRCSRKPASRAPARS